MTQLQRAGLVAGLGAACIVASLVAIGVGYANGEGLASVFWFGVAVGAVALVRYGRMRKTGPVE